MVDVNCGTYATFALTADGSVFAWGLNNYGQLALPGQEPVFAPALVRSLAGHEVASVRAGQHHTLVVTAQGELLSFGRPTYGRLGRREVDVAADVACPEVRRVEGLEGVQVAGAAAGLAVSGEACPNTSTRPWPGQPDFSRYFFSFCVIACAGCFNQEGDAWMWGFGTSNQLGKGDDDEGAGCGPPATMSPACSTCVFFFLQKCHDRYLADGGVSERLMCVCFPDEVVPRKLAETKKFSGQRVVALELGGQHVAMLCVPK